jgi:hypothetical protein
MGNLASESAAGIRLVPDAPADPEEFGVRVVWQSEEERLEAAAFLVATRMQEDVRRRFAKEALDLREQNREKFSTYVAQHAGD